MKIGLWVEQCMHALFECPEDVYEITKTHTKVVSGEFRVISLFFQKIILGFMWRFDSWRLILVYLFK